MARHALRFETTEQGCIVPANRKLNKDGYYRRDVGNRTYVMNHRWVWEQECGPIPEGYEIDHKCKNRACCNLKHLRMLEGREHAIESNTGRNADRQQAAKEYWNVHRCSGTHLAARFGVSIGIGCRWIRKWKSGDNVC